MRQKDAPVYAATETFVKDLGIVLAEAKAVGCPVWLAAAAQQQFLRAVAAGYGKEDDSSLGRLWKDIGVDLSS
jgi:3-hydroxyisobutyrate dehydrogenase-like beta-hydroxyacid dehydrogenase